MQDFVVAISRKTNAFRYDKCLIAVVIIEFESQFYFHHYCSTRSCSINNRIVLQDCIAHCGSREVPTIRNVDIRQRFHLPFQ